MTTRTWLIPLLLVSSAACAESSDDPVARESRRQWASERSERIAMQGQCETSLEIIPPGTRPQRPYRILGPVDGRWGVTARGRFARMRKRACELGADAIMGAWERFEETPGTLTTRVGYDELGRPITVVEEQPAFARRTPPLAIAWTDTPRVYVLPPPPI